MPNKLFNSGSPPPPTDGGGKSFTPPSPTATISRISLALASFCLGIFVGVLGFVFLPIIDYALQWVLVVIDARMR